MTKLKRIVITGLVLLLMGGGSRGALAQPWLRHTVDASSRGADGVRLADLDRDGRLDVVTGWEEGGLVRIYLQPAAENVASPWPAVTIGEVPSVEDAVFADVDDDGRLDVVSAAEGDEQSLFVHWAPKATDDLLEASAWKTEALPSADDRMQWMYVLPFQVDGRRGVDLAAGGKGDNARVGWLAAPNRPRELDRWSWHPLAQVGWIMSIDTLDVDRDGDLDLLMTDRKGPLRGVRWLENPPSRTASASWKNHFIGGRDHEVMFMSLADLDENGRTDVLAATRGKELLYFRRLPTGRTQWDATTITIPASAGTAKSTAVGDIDGDGAPDIVFSCEHAEEGKSGVFWMRRTDDGSWQARDISGPEGIKYDLVKLIDLDRDGDLDVLTCEERAGLGVVWYENPHH